MQFSVQILCSCKYFAYANTLLMKILCLCKYFTLMQKREYFKKILHKKDDVTGMLCHYMVFNCGLWFSDTFEANLREFKH